MESHREELWYQYFYCAHTPEKKNEERIHYRHMNSVRRGPVGDWFLLWYPGWKGMKWGYC